MTTKRKHNTEGLENSIRIKYENTQTNFRKNLDNDSANNNKNKDSSEADLNVIEIIEILSTLDVNNYATRKTIAQGLLDLALLSANASQLKYILSARENHEFYTLLLTLIIFSIILQVLQAIVCVILGMVLNINKVDEQKSANIINNICLAINIITVFINVVISAFDIKAIENIRRNDSS